MKDGDKLTINSIDNLKPDVIITWVFSCRKLGVIKQKQCGFIFHPQVASQGENFINNGKMFQASNHERENLSTVGAKKQGWGSSLSMVLPFLMSGQGQ